MIVIYVLIIIMFAILYVISKSCVVDENTGFRRMSKFIYVKIEKKIRNSVRRENIRKLNSVLYDTKKMDELEEEYIINVIEICLKIALCVTVIAVLLFISDSGKLLLKEGRFLYRNDKMQGNEEVDLIAKIGGEEYQVPYDIAEVRYNLEEIESMYYEYEKLLKKEVLNGNVSSDNVQGNLKFVTSVRGYPFTTKWESDEYMVVGNDGKIDSENIPPKGQNVQITATTKYLDYERKMELLVFVNRAKPTKEEEIRGQILDEILIRDDISKEKEYIELPISVDGEQVLWTQKVEDSSLYIFLLGIAACVAIIMQKNSDISKAMRRREEEMILDYVLIVNQLVLFLQAGMSLRASFNKISKDYQENKKNKRVERRFVFEEIMNLCQELESGLSETLAYENLGKRCNIQTYYKFTTLLSQNTKKGASDIINILVRESQIGLEERKMVVKIRAEQATTKLLIPMMILLAIVMIIVIVPAFLSFNI